MTALPLAEDIGEHDFPEKHLLHQHDVGPVAGGGFGEGLMQQRTLLYAERPSGRTISPRASANKDSASSW